MPSIPGCSRSGRGHHGEARTPNGDFRMSLLRRRSEFPTDPLQCYARSSDRTQNHGPVARTLRSSDPGPKEIAHGSEAQLRILKGLDLATEAIASTLGPQGRSVIIERPDGGPQITSDGCTIARAIELPDRIADMGARIIREVAFRTAADAGDGATTAVVLAGTMAREGVKAIAAGLAPRAVSRGIDRAAAAALAGLARRARPVRSTRQLEAVGTVAADGDAEIGALLARAPRGDRGGGLPHGGGGIGSRNRAGNPYRHAFRGGVPVASIHHRRDARVRGDGGALRARPRRHDFELRRHRARRFEHSPSRASGCW